MTALGTLALLFLLGTPAGIQGLSPGSGDLDRDGLPDGLEQELLVRFSPLWMISSDDCDSLPAEFAAGSREPRVVARNGTIYGQVSRLERPGTGDACVELHYYHLWSRDCGQPGHGLDVEHVSALLVGRSVELQAPARSRLAVMRDAKQHRAVWGMRVDQ